MLTVNSCNCEPLEKRETALDRSWRKPRLILRRGRPIYKIFGAKAHANELKGTFSTDCKSICIRIDLTTIILCVHKIKYERYFKHLRNKYENAYTMHKHVATYCWVPPRLPNKNRRILICSTAAARAAVSLRNESVLFLFSCSVCDWRDMTSECMTYPALLGYNPNRYRYPGYFDKGIPLPRVLCHSLTELTEVPGTGTEDSRNSRKFRVWYGSLTKLTKVLGRYTNVVPVPQVLWHGRAELTEVSGTGMNVVQNSQKFWVRMWMYRIYRSSGTRVIPGETPGYGPVRTLPTEHNLATSCRNDYHRNENATTTVTDQ